MASIDLSRRDHAFKGEGLHADHDDFCARFVAQFDEPLRQGDAGGTGQAENEDEKIAAARNRGEPLLLQRHDFAGERDVAVAAQAVHQAVSQQVTVRHDRAFNRQLIGVEDPEILRRPAMQDQLIAHRRARLAEAEDAHAAGKKLVGLF